MPIRMRPKMRPTMAAMRNRLALGARPQVLAATFVAPTGPRAAKIPCWFEPNTGGGMTACCQKADGTYICADLRY